MDWNFKLKYLKNFKFSWEIVSVDAYCMETIESDKL